MRFEEPKKNTRRITTGLVQTGLTETDPNFIFVTNQLWRWKHRYHSCKLSLLSHSLYPIALSIHFM
ncbi:hypothetical protein HanRHA438_Chr16g0773001 [Helianthus annuus]|nr:hypothetical protein HanRHA438_Chr16g0773001 [Helianthus annuus]